MWLRSRLAWVALACALFGGVVRFVYALGLHHPRNHAWSDAYEYIALAQRLLDAPQSQQLNDTIWPPGTSAIWALLFSIDGSLSGLAIANALASVCVMLLVADAARAIAGATAACWALIFASLHLGYIHYAGFTLAEQWFQLTATFALWSSVRALSVLRPGATASTLTRALWGGAAGVAWGVAALFRPNALPVLATALLVVGVYLWRQRNRAAIALLIGGAAGLLVVITPAADRCTRNAGGSFCLVSNNIAMNMALGQSHGVYGLEFRDPATRENATTWVPPALLHHGYQGLGHVPATIYDTRGVLKWWWNEVTAAPGAALVRAVGNGLDLFGMNYWPDNYGKLGERFAYVCKQIFFALVLIPGLLGLWRWTRAYGAGDARHAEVLFVLSAALGVFAGATLSLGEARYRLPFDLLLLVPAATVYAGVDANALCTTLGAGKRLASATLVIGSLLASAVIAVAHPSIGFGRSIEISDAAWGLSERRDVLDEAAMSNTNKRGQPWDAKGNHVFRCAPACREGLLRVSASSNTPWTHVSLSVDHNDRYRVYFYKDDVPVAFTDLVARGGANGLRVEVLPIPEHARNGLTAVGVAPLYGDARYALGHLKLLSRPR